VDLERSRFAAEPFTAEGPVHGTALSDGFVRATWALDGSTLRLHHAGLGPDARKELEAEGLQFLQFLGIAGGDVRFA
jgi:hypothetical protein